MHEAAAFGTDVLLLGPTSGDFGIQRLDKDDLLRRWVERSTAMTWCLVERLLNTSLAQVPYAS